MIKSGPIDLMPAEFVRELSAAMQQIGELAAALAIPRPDWLNEYDTLSERELVDLWVTSRGRLDLIDTAWNDMATELIDQALATDSVLPGSSEPSV